MNKTALYIGRFQPLHKGHIEFINFALTSVEKLFIVIGSAEKNHTSSNPFSASERFQMINNTMTNLGLKNRVEIFQIPDCNDNNLWVSMIKSYIPRFDIVFTNEPVSTRLFKEASYIVKNHIILNRNIYSGTNVRDKLSKDLSKFSGVDDNWKELVPEAVAEVIEEIDGVNRIKDLNMTDKC